MLRKIFLDVQIKKRKISKITIKRRDVTQKTTRLTYKSGRVLLTVLRTVEEISSWLAWCSPLILGLGGVAIRTNSQSADHFHRISSSLPKVPTNSLFKRWTH